MKIELNKIIYDMVFNLPGGIDDTSINFLYDEWENKMIKFEIEEKRKQRIEKLNNINNNNDNKVL